MRVKKKLSITSAALLLGGLASGQNPVQAQIDDTGAVIPMHRALHVKTGRVVAWGRVTRGGTWYVRFAKSPCANGAEFGHDRTLTCTIKASPGTYHYQSGLAANQQMHDPDIIVDP